MKQKFLYHCSHCGKTVERDSNKAWIKSFCETTGKDVRLMRVKKNRGESNGTQRRKE